MSAQSNTWMAIRAPRAPLPIDCVGTGLATLAALAGEFGPVSFAAVGARRSLTYHVGVAVADPQLRPLLDESLPAAVRLAFPGCEIEPGAPEFDQAGPSLGATWWLADLDQPPDVANRLVRALTELPDGVLAAVAAVLRPAPGRFLARLARRAARLEQGLGEAIPIGYRLASAPLEALGWLVSGAVTGEAASSVAPTYRASPAELARARTIGARLAAGPLAVTLRTVCVGPTQAVAAMRHELLAAPLRAAGATCRVQADAARLIDSGQPDRRDARRGLLAGAELARLLRFPEGDLAELHRVRATRLARRECAPAGLIPLATANTGAAQPLGVEVCELFRHACVVGPPGTGKTALLVRLVLGLSSRGVGGLVLDPHGDLVGELLALLPEQDTERLDVIDLAEAEPVPINPLHLPDEGIGSRAQLAAVRAAAVVEVFDNHWRLTEASAPNFHHHLRMALQALILCGDASLVDLPAFLTDPAFRAQVLVRADDAQIAAHWAAFERLGRSERDMAVRSILNKASAFAATPALRAVFGDPGPGLCLNDYLDGGRLLVVDLAKGRLPEGCGALVGGLLLTLAHQAAMGRQDRPEPQRRPAVVVVDEFAELGFAALGKMINAVRKYRLGLVLASQSIATLAGVDRQLPAHLLGATATKCVFRLHGEDARLLAPALGVTPADLSALGAYECYLGRARADGLAVASGVALPPPPTLRDFAECRSLAAARRPRVRPGAGPLAGRLVDGSGW